MKDKTPPSTPFPGEDLGRQVVTGKHNWTLSFHRHQLRRKAFPSAWMNQNIACFLENSSVSKVKAAHVQGTAPVGWRGWAVANPMAQAAHSAELCRCLDGCHSQDTAQPSRAFPAPCLGSHCSGVVLVMHQHLGTRHIAVVILTHTRYQACQVKVYIRYLCILLSPISAGGLVLLQDALMQ